MLKINIRARIAVCAALYAAALPAQTHIDLRTQIKSADLSSVGATKPAQTGSVLPSTCGTGEVFFLTSAPAGTNLMVCASPNQWSASGGGSLATEANGAAAGTATALNLIPGTYVTQTVICASGTCSYQPDVDTTKIPTNAVIQAGQLAAVITTSSSSAAYTGVMAADDPLLEYAANQQLIWNTGSTACAGGAMTLNIDGLGAIPLKQADGVTNFTGAQCGANAQLALTYDAVNAVFRGPYGQGGTITLIGDTTGSGTGSIATTTSKINGTAFTGADGNIVSFGPSNAPADSGLNVSSVPLLASNNLFTGGIQTINTPGTGGTLNLGSAGTAVLAGSDISGLLALGGYFGTCIYTANLGNLAACIGGAVGSGSTDVTSLFYGRVTVPGLVVSGKCSSVASPAVCGSSSAGIVQVAASASSLVIETTAVTSASVVGCLTYSTVGGTAPTNIASLIQPYVTSISSGTGFTLTLPEAPATNAVGLSFCLL